MTSATPDLPPVPVLGYAGKAPRRIRPAPLWWRLGVMLASLYLPYAWLLVDPYPWSDYRWTWVKLWPILPGLVTAFMTGPRASNLQEFAVMGAATVLCVAGFLLLATRSRRWYPIPAVLALALSACNSWFAYAIFRA
jgi:hypothetical protein